MRRYFIVLAVLAALAAPASAQSPLAENAALKYWQAFEHMPKLDKDQENLLDKWNTIPLDASADILIGRASASLVYLHRGAALPGCDWGLDYEDGPGLLMPHLQKARNLARFACLRARRNLARGDTQAGIDDALGAMTLAKHLATDSTLISILVQYVIDLGALDVLAAHLPKLKPDQLTALGNRLDRLPKANKPQHSMLFEKKYMKDWLIRRLKKLPPGSPWQKEVQPILESDQQLKEIGDLSNEKVLQLLEELTPFYDDMAKMLAEDRRGFPKRWQAFSGKWSAANPFAKLLAPALDKVVDAENRDTVRLAMFRTALAIVKDGPDRIKESRDPFGDGPFEVHSLAGGFELRSKLKYKEQTVSMLVGVSKKE